MKKFNSVIKKIAFFIACSTLLSVKTVASTLTALPDPDPIQADTIIGQVQEFSKLFNKTFVVGKNEVVILSNKYGKIDVKTGATNQVVVNVRVRVNASSQEEAQKMLPSAYKAIDKAAKRGVIKENTAARKKSRLMRF